MLRKTAKLPSLPLLYGLIYAMTGFVIAVVSSIILFFLVSYLLFFILSEQASLSDNTILLMRVFFILSVLIIWIFIISKGMDKGRVLAALPETESLTKAAAKKLIVTWVIFSLLALILIVGSLFWGT